jgi:hypothetical protein
MLKNINLSVYIFKTHASVRLSYLTLLVTEIFRDIFKKIDLEQKLVNKIQTSHTLSSKNIIKHRVHKVHNTKPRILKIE